MKFWGGGAPENKLLSGKKIGFTLAEVLITIGIIGIVAAMTLPTLINDAKNRELQTQLRKTYSELNQMSQLFYNDYGMSVSEYLAGARAGGAWSNFVNKIFPRYFKLVNKVDNWTGGMVDPDTGSAYDIMPYNLYTLKEHKRTSPICDNSGYYSDIIGRYYLFNDSPDTVDDNGPIICVDINGEKQPNTYGKDFFLFVFTVDGYVIPMGQQHAHNKIINGTLATNGVNIGSNYCSSKTSSRESASACAYYAISDVNPEGKGTYWKDFLRGK